MPASQHWGGIMKPCPLSQQQQKEFPSWQLKKTRDYTLSNSTRCWASFPPLFILSCLSRAPFRRQLAVVPMKKLLVLKVLPNKNWQKIHLALVHSPTDLIWRKSYLPFHHNQLLKQLCCWHWDAIRMASCIDQQNPPLMTNHILAKIHYAHIFASEYW